MNHFNAFRRPNGLSATHYLIGMTFHHLVAAEVRAKLICGKIESLAIRATRYAIEAIELSGRYFLNADAVAGTLSWLAASAASALNSFMRPGVIMGAISASSR